MANKRSGRLTASLKDPSRRPRLVLWAGATLIALAAFVVVAISVTSSYWFCAEVCHKVQDDAIIAYDHSSHSEVSCLACHIPANTDPVTFLYHKAKAGVSGAVNTLSGNFEIPLNAASHVAQSEEMGSGQCLQCHSANRLVTPGPGIIIDHAVHEERDVQCTFCHNRVAHPEDFELTLTDPATGEPAHKHADFMSMTACFRCHDLAAGAVAPGECGACHPAGFELKPPSHFAATFYPAGHAEMARQEAERLVELEAERVAEVDAAEHDAEEGAWDLEPVEAVDYCATCHLKSVFCDGCHGLEMPHPTDFSEDHGDLGKTEPDVCARCHAGAADVAATDFCNACHHGGGDPSRTWIQQHYEYVREDGGKSCFECHDPKYCAACHVRSIL